MPEAVDTGEDWTRILVVLQALPCRAGDKGSGEVANPGLVWGTPRYPTLPNLTGPTRYPWIIISISSRTIHISLRYLHSVRKALEINGPKCQVHEYSVSCQGSEAITVFPSALVKMPWLLHKLPQMPSYKANRSPPHHRQNDSPGGLFHWGYSVSGESTGVFPRDGLLPTGRAQRVPAKGKDKSWDYCFQLTSAGWSTKLVSRPATSFQKLQLRGAARGGAPMTDFCQTPLPVRVVLPK